jgi:hypothetical protein
MSYHNFQCNFCERSFNFKELYENHEPICEFFYKKQRDKQREDEKIEKLPSMQDMFHLVQHMFVEINRQKTRIDHLEKIIKHRRKQDSIANTPTPMCNFKLWVRQIEVKREHLLTVFQDDIYEGIRKCIEENIREHGLVKIPIRVLLERPTVLYVYKQLEDKTTKWVLCNTCDILFIVEHLMGEFMRIFCDWEDENKDWISRSMENKDLHVNYLCKITGSMIFYKDRKRQELNNWICQHVRFEL